MKKLKQALSLSLALVLSLALAAPAMAAGTTETVVDERHGVTVTLHNFLRKVTNTYLVNGEPTELTIYVVEDHSVIDVVASPGRKYLDEKYLNDEDAYWNEFMDTWDWENPGEYTLDDSYILECRIGEDGVTQIDAAGSISSPLPGPLTGTEDPYDDTNNNGMFTQIIAAYGVLWLNETDFAKLVPVGGTSTTPTQPQQPTIQISDWAKDQVSRATANGLVADGLGNDYRVNITRAQFAATAVKLYEAMSGQTAPAAGNSPFTDTSDPAVIQAQALGFVSGVGNDQFAPDALVTREQAASMLSRVYTKLGGNIPTVTATTFADNGSVSAWARDAVAFMSDKGIVSGTGNNNFTPQGNASIEQALSIALRMFENLK